MTEAFAKELGPRGITVNAVAPGLIATDMTREAIATRGEPVAAATPSAASDGPATWPQ